MKKLLFSSLFCLLPLIVVSQGLSYGFFLGGVARDLTENQGDDYDAILQVTNPNKNKIPLNFGVFADYNLSESWGVKGNLFYEESFTDIEFEEPNTLFNNVTIRPTNYRSITFQPLAKFDVNQTYGKGFYLLGGGRVSFVLDKDYVSEKFKLPGVFKSTTFGLNLGFGFLFTDFLGVEAIGDFSPNIIEDHQVKIKGLGGYLNFFIKVDELIK